MADTLLCLGYGYTAQSVARRFASQNWQMAGTSRDPARRAAMEKSGLQAIDPEDRAALALALTTHDHWLISAPPGETGDPFLDLARARLEAGMRPPAWIGYLSTVGVYGVRDGSLVDETTPAVPLLDRGKRRLQAENDWRELADAYRIPCFILRIAGIYGPGRNAFEQLKRGTAKRIVKEGQMFNRIHVEDIARVVAAAIAQPEMAGIYNLADDQPAPPQDVVLHAAELAGVEPPPETPFDDAVLSPMAASFYKENKRISNARIKTRLGVKLRYPDYRAGLAAIHAQMAL